MIAGMQRRLALVTVVVPDYDRAIAYYVGTLGFRLVEDIDMGGGKRWVVVAPGDGGSHLLIARAATLGQEAAIGHQAGGRVFLILETDDFDRDHAIYLAAGVHFREAPRDEPYGRVAVFEDAFGNRWDLIQPKR